PRGGIESVYLTGLLTGQENPAAARKRPQDRRCAEIHIGAELLWAIALSRGVRTVTADDVVVAGSQLVHPLDRPRRHVESDDRVGAGRRQIRVGVARADIKQIVVWIEGRRGPDRAAGRTVELGAGFGLAVRVRLLVDRVGLPDHLPRAGIERRDAAAELAALVGGHRRRQLLQR